MDCKGVVTNVNSSFLFFELDNRIKIHMGILMSQNKQQPSIFRKEVNNVELKRIKNLKIFEIQDKDAYFLIDDETRAEEKLLTVVECKNYLLNNTDLVSFEGTLKSKRFADALPSYMPKKTTAVYGFGTPGSKVHQLVFCVENETKVYLDCYLNNWENILMPLGLIPQMRIAVRNVYPQSKKYLKSSAFTTFDIISYDAPVQFNTVNLYKNDKLDWGQRFFLGHGYEIPNGVLIWGRVTNIQILSLTVNGQSGGCKCVSQSSSSGDCIRCQLNERDLDFLLKMHVSDEFGQSKVLAKFPGIMKSILDLQQHQFEIWLKALEEVGTYKYNFFEEEPIYADDKPEVICFRRCLTEFLQMFNEQAVVFLELKCRKLDSNPQKNGGRPLWICLDARRS